MITRFEWTNARSIDDAIGQLNDKSLAKAGGVDLMDRLKEGLDAPSRLVNIRSIPDLDYVKEESGWLRIGPMVTLTTIAEHPVIRQRYKVLADAALNAATPHIRNMATVGGNLLQRPRCWYFRNEQFHCRRKGGDECFAQDGENEYHAIFDNEICAIVHPSAAACALTALGAKVQVKGKKGAREIALDDLFVRPETDVTREHVLNSGELLTEIRVPAPSDSTRSAYTKVGQKESFDWPLSEVAVVLELAWRRGEQSVDRAGRGRTHPLASNCGGESSDRQTAQRTECARRRGCCHAGRHATLAECIQDSDVRSCGAAHNYGRRAGGVMREFMDEPEIETPDPAELPEVCRFIRTKTAYGNAIGYRRLAARRLQHSGILVSADHGRLRPRRPTRRAQAVPRRTVLLRQTRLGPSGPAIPPLVTLRLPTLGKHAHKGYAL